MNHFLIGKEAPNPYRQKKRRMFWVSKKPVFIYDEMLRAKFSHMQIVQGTYRKAEKRG